MHELKTPLSVVRLALDEGGDGSVPRAGADRAVRAMKDVIDRCTQIAYFDQHASHAALDLTPEPIDPTSAIADAVALQASAGRVDIASTNGSSAVHTDRALLDIILANLLDNALKYSPEDARVGIRIAIAARNDFRGVPFGISPPPGGPDGRTRKTCSASTAAARTLGTHPAQGWGCTCRNGWPSD